MEQLLVAPGELLAGFVLVVEDLDDLLAVDRLLDERVDRAEGLLLANEEHAAAGHHGANQHDEQHGEQDGERGEGDGEPQHREEGRDHRDARGEHLRERLRDRLAQGVGVVGVQAHGVAVLMGVEIADGQGLLVGEHLVADGLEGALLDGDDEPVPQPGAQRADQVQATHEHEGAHERPPVRAGLADQRQDVGVDERLQEQGGARLGRGADQDAQHDDADPPPVAHDVSEDALGRAGLDPAHARCPRFAGGAPGGLARGCRLGRLDGA